MLWSKDEKSRAKESVGTSRKDLNKLCFTCYLEVDLGTLGAADPVSLHGFNFVWPVELVDVSKKFVGVVGNLEEPLFHLFLFDFRTTAPTVSVFYLFVGKHGLVDWAPPLIRFFAICKAFFIELQEAPLRPAIILWVRGINLTRPINSITKAF